MKTNGKFWVHALTQFHTDRAIAGAVETLSVEANLQPLKDTMSLASCLMPNLFNRVWKKLHDRDRLIAHQRKTASAMKEQLEQMQRDEEAKMCKEHAGMNGECNRAKDALKRKSEECAHKMADILRQLKGDEQIAEDLQAQECAKTRQDHQERIEQINTEHD